MKVLNIAKITTVTKIIQAAKTFDFRQPSMLSKQTLLISKFCNACNLSHLSTSNNICNLSFSHS